MKIYYYAFNAQDKDWNKADEYMLTNFTPISSRKGYYADEIAGTEYVFDLGKEDLLVIKLVNERLHDYILERLDLGVDRHWVRTEEQ